MSSPSARFFEKSSAGFSKMATRLLSRSTISLPPPSFAASLKSGKSESLLAFASGAMIFLLIWSPMSACLEGDHILEARALGDGDWRVGLAGVLIADIFDEEQD
jgi:hypothetical protein